MYTDTLLEENSPSCVCEDERFMPDRVRMLPSWTACRQICCGSAQAPECLLSLVHGARQPTSPCSGVLCAATSANVIKVFCEESLEMQQCIPAHKSTIHSLSFDSTNGLFLSGSEDGFCSFWDIRDPSLPSIRIDTGDGVFSSASNGRVVAAGSDVGQIKLW